MYYPYAYHAFPSWAGNPKLAEDVAKAVNGEYNAILCYGKLAALAPKASEKKRILEIRQDEIRHYQIFSHIYAVLTGRLPQPTGAETCPEEYPKGLRFAFEDEQETVDFYLNIADQAADLDIKELFRRAAADEQHHAVWFLSFLTLQNQGHGKSAM